MDNTSSCKCISFGDITIWLCNPEESYFKQLELECIQQEKERELELDLERQQELINETPIIVDPEVIPFKVISDWAFYNGI